MKSNKIKILLFIFCLIGTVYSSYLVVQAVLKKDVHKSFAIRPIDVPRYFDDTGEEIKSVIPVDEITIVQVRKFKNYMDSLKQNDVKTYDSILKARPLLMDSIAQVEAMYYEQKNK